MGVRWQSSYKWGAPSLWCNSNSKLTVLGDGPLFSDLVVWACLGLEKGLSLKSFFDCVWYNLIPDFKNVCICVCVDVVCSDLKDTTGYLLLGLCCQISGACAFKYTARSQHKTVSKALAYLSKMWWSLSMFSFELDSPISTQKADCIFFFHLHWPQSMALYPPTQNECSLCAKVHAIKMYQDSIICRL